MWNEKAQRAQRRPGLLHGATQIAVTDKGPHEQSKPQLVESQPGDDLADELYGRLDRQNPVPALVGAGLVGKELEHASVDDEDHPGNAAPNAPRYDQGAKDTPSCGQHDERADHRCHDSDGHALAWHGYKRQVEVKVGERSKRSDVVSSSGRNPNALRLRELLNLVDLWTEKLLQADVRQVDLRLVADGA